MSNPQTREDISQAHSLIQNLFLKQQLLKENNPSHQNIRPVLLILSGGMRGVYGAGAAIALHLLGLGSVFDYVIGISSGAAIGAYFLAGMKQTLLGASIYYEECASTQCLNYWRFTKILDVDFIESILRGGRKKLDIAAIRQSRSQFFVGVADVRTGQGMFLDAKEAKPDLVTAVKASLAVPGLYNQPVRVNDRLYVDGAVSFPFPVTEVVEALQPTDLLVITNESPSPTRHWFPWCVEHTITRTLLRRFPPVVQEASRTRHRRFHEGLQHFRDLAGMNKAILWVPTKSIHQLTRDSKQLRQAVEDSIRMTFDIVGAQPTECTLSRLENYAA